MQVALHFTPVSHSLGWWVVVSNLANFFCAVLYVLLKIWQFFIQIFSITYTGTIPMELFNVKKVQFFISLSKLVLDVSKHNYNLMSSCILSLCDCRGYDAATILILHLIDNLECCTSALQHSKKAFLLGSFASYGSACMSDINQWD